MSAAAATWMDDLRISDQERVLLVEFSRRAAIWTANGVHPSGLSPLDITELRDCKEIIRGQIRTGLGDLAGLRDMVTYIDQIVDHNLTVPQPTTNNFSDWLQYLQCRANIPLTAHQSAAVNGARTMLNDWCTQLSQNAAAQAPITPGILNMFQRTYNLVRAMEDQLYSESSNLFIARRMRDQLKQVVTQLVPAAAAEAATGTGTVQLQGLVQLYANPIPPAPPAYTPFTLLELEQARRRYFDERKFREQAPPTDPNAQWPPCENCNNQRARLPMVSMQDWITGLTTFLYLFFERPLVKPVCPPDHNHQVGAIVPACDVHTQYTLMIRTILRSVFHGVNGFKAIVDKPASDIQESLDKYGGFSLQWFMDWVFPDMTTVERNRMALYENTGAEDSFANRLRNHLIQRLPFAQSRVCIGCLDDYSPASPILIARYKRQQEEQELKTGVAPHIRIVTQIGPIGFVYARLGASSSSQLSRAVVIHVVRAMEKVATSSYQLPSVLDKLHKYTGLLTMIAPTDPNASFAGLEAEFLIHDSLPDATRDLIDTAIKLDTPIPMQHSNQITSRQQWNRFENLETSAMGVLFQLCEYGHQSHRSLTGL